MPTTLRFLVIAFLLAFACAASVVITPRALAAVDTYEFETEEQQQRFRTMSNDFRCPMCQNTNLTGSGGGVAEDLRREIYLMILDGKTNAEIEQFMLQRYGDFIFYKPRLMRNTLLLWFGPLIFLAIGGWIILRIVRRARPGAEQKHDTLDPAELERLRRLLGK
jgi:cytochrome c-type biogenesis protein CcmH